MRLGLGGVFFLAFGMCLASFSAAQEPYLLGKAFTLGIPVDIAATAAAPKDAPKAKQNGNARK